MALKFPIELNSYQAELIKNLNDPEIFYYLARGGTGSGKTVAIIWWLVQRAQAIPGSRQAVFRSTLKDVRDKIFLATFKEVLNAVWESNSDLSNFDLMHQKGMINLERMEVRFPNGSTILFGGLDEGKDLDRVLGADYTTIFLNEISTIDHYSTISTLETRIRQKLTTLSGNPAKTKFVMDCNPPSPRHWSHAAFKLKRDPKTGIPHPYPNEWGTMNLHPAGNAANLSDNYLRRLEAKTGAERAKFLEGEWYEVVENAMFQEEWIALNRLPRHYGPDDCDDFSQIMVAVDPAGSNHEGSDETGIIVLASDEENHAYILEDLSGKYTPTDWANVAVEAYHRWKANKIVAERNMGGNLVEANIRTADPNVPISVIWSSRGKDIRAEASATAYSQGRIHHQPSGLEKLEAQVLNFEVGFDRRKKGSPDRLDALVHGLNSILVTNERQPSDGGTVRVRGLFS